MPQTPAIAGEMPKTYAPADHEDRIRAKWNASGAFHAEAGPVLRGEKPPYCILIPPPNVTAPLHLGHALNNTLQDALIRAHRMKGFEALWMPGTDHAGIATQAVVEKRLLAEEGKKRTDFQRDEFIARVQAWKDEYEATITDQLKRLGASCDWERQRFTMDEVCARAVREGFFRLFKAGLIYRGKRLVNWDPILQTALADDEVEMKEVKGRFYYLRYPLVHPSTNPDDPKDCQEVTWNELAARGYPGADKMDGEEVAWVTVATTRPETYLGDTAVAVNPKDPRAGALRGLMAQLPIVGRVIPVIEDDYVVLADPESSDPKAKFATGFLKVTPAHDPNDYMIGQRHDLEMINVMAPDASISDAHGWDREASDEGGHVFVGKSREEARELVVREFEARNLLEAKKPYEHSVGHSDRSKVPIEPYLSDQWYVRVTDDRLRGEAQRALSLDQRTTNTFLRARSASEDGHAAPPPNSQGSFDATDAPSLARASGSSGSKNTGDHAMRFFPARYAKTYEAWHDNLRDWCISRQLWWGHRIPVWSISRPFRHDDPRTPGEAWLYPYPPEIKEAHQAQQFDDRMRGFAAEDRLFARAWRDDQPVDPWTGAQMSSEFYETYFFVSVQDGNDSEVIEFLESNGFTQDPDVLDTWFSSALWPISTMGWPDPTQSPEFTGLLDAFNPSTVLSTGRDIITLWVSRMAMFNRFFLGSHQGCRGLNESSSEGHADSPSDDLSRGLRRRASSDHGTEHHEGQDHSGPVPFYHVYIHPIIQDGHGQRMSKSLGNGVDPLDLIHSHGADALRFGLCQIATATQDVRMPVDLACPHCAKTFEPKTAKTPQGYVVAAPEQKCPHCSKPMVSAYGSNSGTAKPSSDKPLARNTSSRLDEGRNFCNKLWNASRFAMGMLSGGTGVPPIRDSQPEHDLSLPDRWMLSRLAAAIDAMDDALSEYHFARCAEIAYDLLWRDFCDWYLESIKPTIATDPQQQAVLRATLDAILRLLHPLIPFVTETIYERLQEIETPPAPGLDLDAPTHDALLCSAPWPRMDATWRSEKAESEFERLQTLVRTIRDVRGQQKVHPRRKITLHVDSETATELVQSAEIVAALAGVGEIAGPDVQRPDNAVALRFSDRELHLSDLTDALDADAERERLEREIGEHEKSLAALDKRLSNPGYTDKAPAHLVEETRSQRAKAAEELAAARNALEAL